MRCWLMRLDGYATSQILQRHHYGFPYILVVSAHRTRLTKRCWCQTQRCLTDWGRAAHICVGKIAPSHYLRHWRNIVNWTLENKPQWDFNRNSNIFIQENAFESVVCEIAAILSRPQCVTVRKRLAAEITMLYRVYIDYYCLIHIFICSHTLLFILI